MGAYKPVEDEARRRLFDRDTLILQDYNINSLYVLNAYVASNATDRDAFRNDTRQTFRQRLIDHLNEQYTFWQVTPTTEPLETFIQRHFWVLRGKMYRPSGFDKAILAANPKTDVIDLPALFDASAKIAAYALA